MNNLRKTAAGIIAAIALAAMTILPGTANAAGDYVIDNANVISAATKDKLDDANKQAETNGLPVTYIYTSTDFPNGVDENNVSNNDNDVLMNQTDKPSESIVLTLYVKPRKIGMRYGTGVNRGITRLLTESNVYNSQSKSYLQDGDYDNGMRAAASNVINYINQAANTGDSAASNQNAPEQHNINWNGVWTVILGIIGIIIGCIGLLMCFAAFGRAKNDRHAVEFIRKHANDTRFGSASYNSRYTDDGWTAAVIREINEHDAISDVNTDKSAVKTCYKAGKAIYMREGFKTDIAACKYYDATIDYTNGLKDSDIEMGSFNLQDTVNRVNSRRKAETADRKRYDDALNKAINLFGARTTVSSAEHNAIMTALDEKRDSLIGGGAIGNRKPDLDGINDVINDTVVESRAKAYARDYLSSHAYMKEIGFDNDAFENSVIYNAKLNGEMLIAGNTSGLDDYSANMFAKLNKDAKEARERREKLEREEREHREKLEREVRERREREEQARLEREREERYHHHDDSMSSALAGAAIGGLAGYALGSHDDYNPFDGGGFGNDDNGFSSGFGGNDDNGFSSGFDFGGSDDSFDGGGFDSDF